MSAALQFGNLSANTLSVLLFLGQAIISIIGWYLLAKRAKGAEMLKHMEESNERIAKLEKYNKRFLGWILGRFGVDLNGD